MCQVQGKYVCVYACVSSGFVVNCVLGMRTGKAGETNRLGSIADKSEGKVASQKRAFHWGRLYWASSEAAAAIRYGERGCCLCALPEVVYSY